MEGEAYFDVTKQAASPFIVHTRDLHVEVLGTAFNVKSYPNDDRTEATLIRGLVQVRRTGDSREKALLLHPHEKVVVNRSADNQEDQPLKPITVQQLKHNLADTSLVETAWVYNKLVFDGEDFRDIANEMERWYNVKISITDPAIARYRFHAKFENETIAEVLAALQASRPFTFKINNHEINIYK
ncbi:MAG: FecR family protein [Candidatus Pseudobacter hemicellulosilyticus]|uniref:FecR family protein n=1 Tax=Candidatus Pseudobacter hemicellulosilyticus TaxID=3121375 RepID=A0AAJ5WWF4_9BACT|nr:MAG: FecR family protein [Pseudobacter sp.]